MISYTKSIISLFSFLFFFTISFSVNGQSLDWVVEPIISDSESINLNLKAQNNTLNLVSVRNGTKWGMKNIKNEVIAPYEFKNTRVWANGKYFSMMEGRVIRYFDPEGYEVDQLEVDTYQKTINKRKRIREKDEKLKNLKEQHELFNIYAVLNERGYYKYVATNKETGDTICSQIGEKSFFTTSDKYSIQNNAETKKIEVRNPTGQVVKTLADKTKIDEVRSDRIVVSLDRKKELLTSKGEELLPLMYTRIRFVTDNYLSLSKDDETYELVDLDGNAVPNASGSNIYSSGIDGKIAIVKSKYEVTIFDVGTKEKVNYPFKLGRKKIGEGTFIVTNKDTLSGLFDILTDTEIIPCKYRRVQREGSFIVAGNYKSIRHRMRNKKKTKYLSVINLDGTVVLEDSLMNVTVVDNKILIVKGVDGLYKVHDINGELIKELPENTVISTSKCPKYFSASIKGEKYNYLTVEDFLAENIKLGYSSVSEYKGNRSKTKSYMIVKRGDKIGLIDSAGDIIIPIELDKLDIGHSSDKYIAAIKDGKWGVLNNPLYEPY
ncbi:MAG: hypothetical protein ACJA1A_001723 [Saprospiraceae bacterium]|jgi:hypothetical protein